MYHIFVSDKFANDFKNNNNNIKTAIKANNNSIITIKIRTKKNNNQNVRLRF